MRELFYEESAVSARAKQEGVIYMIFLVLAIACFAIAAITAFFATSALQGIWNNAELSGTSKTVSTVSWVLTIVVLIGAGLVFFFLKNRFNVSYDYTFVEDELRVTKVFNGRRRKYIATLKSLQILKIGRCAQPSFEATVRGLRGKKPKIMTPNKTPDREKERIYVLVSGSIENTLYVLECRQTLLEHLVRAAGVTKFESQ